MAHTKARPTSPHLQVYKWGPHMAVSILNRAMGVGLATVGVAVLTWWLVAAASGEEAYASFHTVFVTWAGGWPGKVVGIGLTFAWLLHLFSGIRHFVLDAGAGFELNANRNSAIMALVGAILGTGIIWMIIFWKGM